MLISTKYKFIFIHNYKVAGRSLSDSLIKYAAKDPVASHFGIKIAESNALLGKIYKKICKKVGIDYFEAHNNAKQIMDKVGYKIWNSYFKFGLVRNPWDWQVSLYHYMLQNKNHHQHKIIKKMYNFDQYIKWRVYYDKRLQKDFFYNEERESIIDYIGKFEHLQKEFNYICSKLGINSQLPHKNASKREKNYRKYYNEETKDLVCKHFAEDINLFGYQF